MPKIITNLTPTDVVTQLIVPRDGESIEAGDVNTPFNDLLGNDSYLLTAIHNLSQEVQELKKLRGGFNLAVQAQLPTEPARSYPVPVGIGRTDGFTEAVNLSVQNLPAGISAAFDPATVSGGSSVMTINVDPAAVAGTYDIQVIGTSATRTSSAPMQINVAAATLPTGFDFSLPAVATIDRAIGTTATLSLDVTRQGGLTDPINFSLQNLPAGVTATWGANPVTGNASSQPGATTLTLTAGGTVPAGTYSLIVRAVCGSVVVTRSVALRLTVAPVAGQSDFSLRVEYDAGDPLATNGATVYIDRSNGYAGPVTLSIPSSTYGPVILINGQPWSATVSGNSARIVADGTGRPNMDVSAGSNWSNVKVGWAGVTQIPAGYSGSSTSSFVQGSATIDGKIVNRYANVTWLWQRA